MSPPARLSSALFASTLLAGCSAQATYNKAPATGKFTGEPRMVAIAPNTFFFFQPAHDQNFAFTTHQRDPKLDFARTPGRGQYRHSAWTIKPEDMITTGANVPRRFWFVRGFGAFDFTRAAIIHDWLFEAHHRYKRAEANFNAAKERRDEAAMKRNKQDMDAYGDYANLGQDDAADIFAECIKVTMQQSENILNDLKTLPPARNNGGGNGSTHQDNLKDLKEALQVNSPKPGTLWAYHYFVSPDCFVGKSTKIWKSDETDIAIYRELADKRLTAMARKKGYMSDWLIHRFEDILKNEERRHQDYERAKEQGFFAKAHPAAQIEPQPQTETQSSN